MSDLQEACRKVFIVTKKEIQDHKEVAISMSWCELASIIIDLELEKYELRSHLTKNDIKRYDKLLEIYEAEKLERVQNLATYTPWYH